MDEQYVIKPEDIENAEVNSFEVVETINLYNEDTDEELAVRVTIDNVDYSTKDDLKFDVVFVDAFDFSGQHYEEWSKVANAGVMAYADTTFIEVYASLRNMFIKGLGL